jgi:ribosomal protein S6--L-glutamate ligase
MKIALLARNPHLYSHRRICEAARARGHDIEVLNTLRVSINITSRRPMLFYRKRRLEDFDAVIPRIGASITFYGLAVLRQFEVMGVYPLNESVAIGRSRDKLRCLQLLARRGIGLPVTAYTNDPKQAEDIIDLVGGAPVVIKLLEGTQGIGVVLGETVKSAKSVIEAFHGANVNILVQQFIKEAEAMDIRLLVIGDRVVAAMKRQGSAGEFRSNLHRGGLGEKVRITPQERTMAVRAARTLGLNVCGVDMLRAEGGPLVVEVNSSPGIEGLEKATGVDVAGLMIEFLERNATHGNTRTKGKG